jgi:hypothetical protein
VLSRSGRSHTAQHLRSNPAANTYNQEDDVLLAGNFGGVLGSYPTGRLYLQKITVLEHGFYWALLPIFITAKQGFHIRRKTQNTTHL